MHPLERVAAILLCVASLTGCANWAVDMAPDRPDQPWNPAVTATGEIVPGAKSPIESQSGYVLPANAELAKLPQPFDVDRRRVYSLPELIDIAEMNNPLTRTAWNEARKIALVAGIAESTFLPRITATAVGAYLTNDGGSASATIPVGTSTLGANANTSSTARGTISVASLQWLLFDFGERAAIVDAARQASVASNIAFTAAHQQVIYEVSVAFYVYAAARARAATAVQSLKNAQSVQAAARDRSKNSIGTVVEDSQATQATAQAKLAVVQTTGAAQDAYLTLISAMGISPLTKIRVADVSRRRLSPAMSGPVENVIEIALARRPDVLTAYALQKASLAKVRAAEAEFFPKVFLSGNRVYNSGNLNVTAIPSVGEQAATVNLSGSRNSSSVLIGATVPLYDAGVRAAMLGQAQADADNAETMLTRRRNEAVRQIVLSDNALRTSLSAYSASQALSSAAQTTFDAALAAYRNGVGSITDVTMAQTQLLLARNSSSDAYSTALSAAASLALSTGALGTAPGSMR
jgi:outer membrane protein